MRTRRCVRLCVTRSPVGRRDALPPYYMLKAHRDGSILRRDNQPGFGGIIQGGRACNRAYSNLQGRKHRFLTGKYAHKKKNKGGRDTQEGGSNNRRHDDTIENRTRQHRHGGTATSANCRGIQAQRTNTMSMHENTTKANTRRTSPL